MRPVPFRIRDAPLLRECRQTIAGRQSLRGWRVRQSRSQFGSISGIGGLSEREHSMALGCLSSRSRTVVGSNPGQGRAFVNVDIRTTCLRPAVSDQRKAPPVTFVLGQRAGRQHRFRRIEIHGPARQAHRRWVQTIVCSYSRNSGTRSPTAHR